MEPQSANGSTAVQEPTWPELLGSNHWQGLLDPLNLSLRKLILNSGDLCQATYDAFNADKHSKYTGSSRYGKKRFFEKVEFVPEPYAFVSCFLYATAGIEVPEAFIARSLSADAWSLESNWIGYIAVSSDEESRRLKRRVISVAWRGTIRPLEWADVILHNQVPIQSLLTKADSLLGADEDDIPKVMKGWHTLYTSSNPDSVFTKLSAREQVLAKVKELVSQHRDEDLSLICTGHSLGAALAILNAFDVVENGLSKVENKPEFPVTAIVFGSPQVGNKAFNEKLKKLPNLRVLHVKNKKDLIPLYPSGLLGYENTAAVELVINSGKSPSLKDSKNPGDWHNLQGMLHVVAGWRGEEEFELQVKRSLALVNKSSELLKDEYLVPGSWWVEKNKGMVKGPDGEWSLAPPSADNMPVPEF